jgi:hypothetical protein
MCEISLKHELQGQLNPQHVKNQTSIAVFQPSNLG